MNGGLPPILSLSFGNPSFMVDTRDGPVIPLGGKIGSCCLLKFACGPPANVGVGNLLPPFMSLKPFMGGMSGTPPPIPPSPLVL